MPIRVNDQTGEAVFLTPEGDWKPTPVRENPQTKERIAYDGKDWVPLTPPDTSYTYGDIAKSALRGIPIGGGMYEQSMSPEEQARAKNFDKQHPYISGAAGLAGGAAATIPLAMTGPGAALLGLGARGLAGGVARGLASGTGIGALDAATRGQDPVVGGVVGGLTGGALPVAASAVSGVAGPLASNIRARINPQGAAASHVARAVSESPSTAQQIERNVQAAAREGQGEYTVMDAMGVPGQRLARSVASAEGPGRTQMFDLVEGRQDLAGQRVARHLDDAFGTGGRTAAQEEARLTAARNTAADTGYGAVRANAGNVNVTPVVNAIDRTLAPGASSVFRPASNIADDSIEGALRKARGRLVDDQGNHLTDFTAVERAYDDITDAMNSAFRAGKNKVGSQLSAVHRELGRVMEDASEGFRSQNQKYARRSGVIEQIGEGTSAAKRGRPEDNIAAFAQLGPLERRAFRTGYVDPLVERVERSAAGADKARPFTSQGFAEEARTMMLPGQHDLAMRRLAREREMFATRQHAIGGSRTDMNLADQKAGGIDPGMILSLAHGNIGAAGGILGKMMHSLGDLKSGYTPAVREEIARILMSRGNDPRLVRAIGEAVAAQRRMGRNADALMATIRAAAATIPASQEKR